MLQLKNAVTHKGQYSQSLQHLVLREALVGQISHSLVSDHLSALHLTSLCDQLLHPVVRCYHSHYIWGTLTSTLFPLLQRPPQSRGQHLKYPSIRVLVNEGPVKVEDNEILAHSGYRSSAVVKQEVTDNRDVTCRDYRYLCTIPYWTISSKSRSRDNLLSDFRHVLHLIAAKTGTSFSTERVPLSSLSDSRSPMSYGCMSRPDATYDEQDVARWLYHTGNQDHFATPKVFVFSFRRWWKCQWDL